MVETAAQPRITALRRTALRLARAMTTPLLPDDYIALLNPAWSTRESTGTIVALRRETADATTVVIRPNFPWPGHAAGQYLRIGAEINGIRHWRAYSITSDPGHPDDLLSITIKHVEGGKMSPFFTSQVAPGTLVFLGEVEGEFRLPKGPVGPSLMLSAGSGITPIFAMLRELERRGDLQDVIHVHSARTADDVIFADQLRALDARCAGYRLHEQLTGADGRVSPDNLDELVPDWRERETFLSGPRDMIDTLEAHWEAAGLSDRLHTERFQPIIGRGDAEIGSGGTVRFCVTDVDAACDVGVSMLVGGEEAGALLPYGCRMGICHTCVGKLRSGQVRDLRTGMVHGEEGQTVRTCVNAPEGHVEIEL